MIVTDSLEQTVPAHFPIRLINGYKADAKEAGSTFQSRIDQGVDADTVPGFEKSRQDGCQRILTTQ